MTRIEQVPLTQVTPGTAVAADVRDGQGNFLLGAGSVVSERVLAQLARRGIETLPVMVRATLAPEEREARRAALAAELAARFSCVQGDEWMDRLHALVLRYRQEEL